MEWYRKADGEVVTAWAEAVVHGRLQTPLEHRYNAASIVKRAQGAGVIQCVEGLDRLLADHGDAVVAVELLPVGAPRRDWRASLIRHGMVIVRDPSIERLLEITDRFGTGLQMYAG